jgi:Calcineurin-like phosphoesterase
VGSEALEWKDSAMTLPFVNIVVRQTVRAKAALGLWLVPLFWVATVGTHDASAQTNLDVTFFVGSDLHYGVTVGTNYSADVCRATLDGMNALPGQNYPANAGGGTVAPPRGVLLIGDLTESGAAADWGAFTNDWGLNGERRLTFPVYEAYGNHDCAYNPAVPVLQGIRTRNPLRPGVSNISTNGYHYSWDWDSLHLICLNVFPEQTPGAYGINPGDSLSFLVDDLARIVRKSGRPVVIYHHYGFDSFGLGYWTDQQRSTYFQAIKNYNVIAIFAGHNHLVNYIPWQGLNTINDGTIGKTLGPGYVISFLVAHVTRDRLTVVEHRSDGSWGNAFNANITTRPEPRIINNPSSTAASVGSVATLAVNASGPNLNYQWIFNGTNALAGATDQSLCLTNLRLSQTGSYAVLVSNSVGAAVSQPAILEVTAELDVSPVTGIVVSGEVGAALNLEYADTLTPAANWQPLATVTLTNTSQVYIDSSTPAPGQRFYRGVSLAAPLSIAQVPRVTVFGDVGDSLRLEYNNTSDPTANWLLRAALTLTNTAQSYTDTSAPGLSRRYRAIAGP